MPFTFGEKGFSIKLLNWFTMSNFRNLLGLFELFDLLRKKTMLYRLTRKKLMRH